VYVTAAQLEGLLSDLDLVRKQEATMQRKKVLRYPHTWSLVVALLCCAVLSADALCAPGITITSLPPFGVSGSMQGTVSDVDPSQYRVASFILVPGVGWFAKPTGDDPTVPINPDGTWSANVDTGGMDTRATIYSAWLVPEGYRVPAPLPPQNYRVPAELNKFAHDVKERYGRTVEFAGRTWSVRDSPLPSGPEANRFSSRESDVWVDSAGLHLTLKRRDGSWWGSEVTLLGPHLGYGTYFYQTNSRTDILDVNVVFGGGFTWDDYGDEESPDGSHHREIDIGEDSRWGQPGIPNTQNVKHPYKFGPANEHRFHLPDLSRDARLTRVLVWRPDSLRFVTVRGHYSTFDYPRTAVANEYTYTHDPASKRYVPVPGRERIHFNLWLNNLAKPPGPTDGLPVEVVITNFFFTPLKAD
jgi:hypothetical protein